MVYSRTMVLLRIKKVGEVEVPQPEYATAGAAAFDLRAAIKETLTLMPGERYPVPTGLAMAIPQGYEGQLRPRSGSAKKNGLGMVNSPGTIDSDYRGEVHALLINLGRDPITIEPLDRIGQMVISPVIQAQFEWATELDETVRGAGGFGSTGR